MNAKIRTFFWKERMPIAQPCAAGWGSELIKLDARHASYFAPGWNEERDEFIIFFISSWCKIASMARNIINNTSKQQRRPLPSLLSLSFFYAIQKLGMYSGIRKHVVLSPGPGGGGSSSGLTQPSGESGLFLTESVTLFRGSDFLSLPAF